MSAEATSLPPLPNVTISTYGQNNVPRPASNPSPSQRSLVRRTASPLASAWPWTGRSGSGRSAGRARAARERQHSRLLTQTGHRQFSSPRSTGKSSRPQSRSRVSAKVRSICRSGTSERGSCADRRHWRDIGVGLEKFDPQEPVMVRGLILGWNGQPLVIGIEVCHRTPIAAAGSRSPRPHQQKLPFRV